MTSDEKTVIDCLLTILRRKANHSPLDDNQYLSASIDEFELDSIDRLDFVMEVEQRFDVIFTTSAIARCKTIEEILAMIRDERSRAAVGPFA